MLCQNKSLFKFAIAGFAPWLSVQKAKNKFILNGKITGQAEGYICHINLSDIKLKIY
jgi:hypothetical protein